MTTKQLVTAYVLTVGEGKDSTLYAFSPREGGGGDLCDLWHVDTETHKVVSYQWLLDFIANSDNVTVDPPFEWTEEDEQYTQDIYG